MSTIPSNAPWQSTPYAVRFQEKYGTAPDAADPGGLPEAAVRESRKYLMNLVRSIAVESQDQITGGSPEKGDVSPL